MTEDGGAKVEAWMREAARQIYQSVDFCEDESRVRFEIQAVAIIAACAPAPTPAPTGEQIKHMVERFLAWKLPENFNPDGGISFKKAINEDRPSWPQKNEPVGTNLFDYAQAEEMVRYMVEGMPGTPAPSDRTCPTCGTDLRCVHDKLFSEKCEPCESETGAPSVPAAVDTQRKAAASLAMEALIGVPGTPPSMKEQCSSCGEFIGRTEEYQVYFGKDGVRLTCHSRNCEEASAGVPGTVEEERK